MEESKGELCDFFEKVAFFNITGNKCTDGGIILIGGLVLLMVAWSRMLYGKLEYEI